MKRTWLRLTCLVLTLIGSSTALADCRVGSTSPQQVIVACSLIVDSPNAGPDRKAQALIERALARRELLSPTDLHQYDAAILDIEQALEIRPRSAEAHYALAGIHQKTLAFERAISEYDKALAINDEVADMWAGRGLANLGLNRTTEAMHDFDRVVAAAPDKPDGYFGRALVFYRSGDFARSLAEMDQALEIDPVNSDLLLTRAHLRTGTHDFEGAIADFSTFIDAHQAGPEAYFQRGLVFELLGDTDAAKADFESAVRLGPENDEYRAALTRVSGAD